MERLAHSSVDYQKKTIPWSLNQRIVRPQQQRIYNRFAAIFPPSKDARVLDLGVNGSLADPDQHFFEASYPYPEQIVAAGLETPHTFQTCYPNIEYKQVFRGVPLPFKDKEFDIVFSSAVIEHVGSREEQRRFIGEVLRVGRQAFITTPNRWFPIEMHTILPLVHFLPTKLYRRLLRALGFDFFADEANLNLLDKGDLQSLLDPGTDYRILKHYFMGFPSNLLLVINGLKS